MPALKVIAAGLPQRDGARALRAEARSGASAAASQRGLVFHLGTEGETWFYAMEYIDGET
jgi:hypothetical protein